MMEEGLDESAMRRRYRERLIGNAEAAGVPAGQIGFYVKDSIADMNVIGITRYWRKLAERLAT
jgi:hypothetical protein